mgnify:FL=1
MRPDEPLRRKLADRAAHGKAARRKFAAELRLRGQLLAGDICAGPNTIFEAARNFFVLVHGCLPILYYKYSVRQSNRFVKIADYFKISIDELEEGIDLPVDYDNIDTSTFNQQVWQHMLEQNNYDEHKSIDAYLNFEKAKMRDVFNGSVIKDNHGIIGNANAPVHINNGEVTLSAQETELINLFRKMSVIQQAQLLVNATELLGK